MSTQFVGMNAAQIAWYKKMDAISDAINDAWQHDRKLAYRLFDAKYKQQIDLACKRLGIELAEAWDMDGWDGEEDASMITYGRQLQAVRMKLAGEKIPEFWFESVEDAMEAQRREMGE